MEEKYIAAGGRLLYAGGGRLWLVDPAGGRVLEAPEEAGPVLQLADRFRTLREHRQALLEAGWQDDGSGTLDALLAGLVRDGLLRSRADLLRRIQEAPAEAPPPPVAAITWVTRDRPELLRRSVESAIANLRQYGRRAELRVYDDSAEAPARQDSRDMLADLGRHEGFPVFYAGVEEKRAFAAALQARAEQVSAETIEFALFDPFGIGYTPGANTNALLLDTCGKLILQADDDTVFRFASPPEAEAGLRLSSAADPTEVRFFAGSREREAAVTPDDADVLAAHEALLGRSVADCLRQNGGEADCGEASPEFLTALAARGGRMAATMTGVCGDSGMGSPFFVLWLSGRSREAVMGSAESYQAARRSREVLRAVPCATISQGAFFMTMLCGLDNRLTLPPFLPVLRNADGLSAQVLRAAHPEGLVAHLPAAVLHLPGERRGFSGQKRAAPRLADLFLLLVRSLTPPGWQRDSAQRLSAIGGGFVQAGSLPPGEFEALLRELWAEEMSRHVLALERLLGEHDGQPDYWAADTEAWLEQTRLQVTAKEPLVPVDLEDGALAQRAMRAYGELLLAWPSLRAASAAIVSSGAPLASPL